MKEMECGGWMAGWLALAGQLAMVAVAIRPIPKAPSRKQGMWEEEEEEEEEEEGQATNPTNLHHLPLCSLPFSSPHMPMDTWSKA